MKLKKYIAKDTKEALKRIREELGENAIIYSNRQVDNGVEIVASEDSEEAQQQFHQQVAAAPKVSKEKDDAILSHYLETPQEVALKHMQSEFKSLKSLVQEQLSNLIWEKTKRQTPAQAMILRKLLERGFTTDVANRLLLQMPTDISVDELWKAVEDSIANAIQPEHAQLLENSGVFCFLGSPGVGKTKTIAKLAALYSLKIGHENVAIISLDNKRIGAFDEIKIYGKILDVSVYPVENEDELIDSLKSCKTKQVVLIDTPGLCQQNDDQLSFLCDQTRLGISIETILLLPANLQYQCFERIFNAAKPYQVQSCILTKLDEVDSFGEVLSAVIEQQLSILCLSAGEKIPDDLIPFNKSNLIHQALHNTSDGVHLSEEHIARKISEVYVNEL